MCFRIFVLSNMFLWLGVMAVFLGDYVLPGLAPYTLPAGALLVGIAGIAGGISGVVLVWKPDAGS